MRKLSKSSFDYYILPNKMLCSIVGMWPFDEEPSTWKIVFARFRLIFSILGICSFLVPQVTFIAMNWGDLEILTRAGSITMTGIQLLFKALYLLARRKTAHRLYKELRSLWDSSDNPTERESNQMFAYWARIGSITFYLSVVLTANIYVSPALFVYIKDKNTGNSSSSNRYLPFDGWYGTDDMESPVFEIALLNQVVMATICTIVVSGIATTCSTIILHISDQFRLVSGWMTNIGVKINYVQTGYLCHCSPNLVTGLIRCIRHHQRLIDVVNEINSLLTPMIFLQLLTSGVEICLSGFAFLNRSAGVDIFKPIAYLISMMLQLLLWCVPGEILMQESKNLGYSIYLNVPWYKLPPIYRRHILLMILKSQRFCSISTLMFETLSLHTLTGVFNVAASYLTLLLQMQEKSLSSK